MVIPIPVAGTDLGLEVTLDLVEGGLWRAHAYVWDCTKAHHPVAGFQWTSDDAVESCGRARSFALEFIAHRKIEATLDTDLSPFDLWGNLEGGDGAW